MINPDNKRMLARLEPSDACQQPVPDATVAFRNHEQAGGDHVGR